MSKIQSMYPGIDQCLRENLVVISGHGSFYNSPKIPGAKLKVKAGVTVTLWQGLGQAMDDGTTGQWLDRGCTVTALSKLSAQGKEVKTYEEGDLIPNLILSPPGKLNIRANEAGDAHCAFGKAVGSQQGFIVNPDACITIEGVQSTSLFHIMQHALDNNLGSNFQWAACTSTITIRKPWFVEQSNVNMVNVAKQLYALASKHPKFDAWKE